MPVFSYVLEKVSRWELPSLHLPRREFSSPLSGRHLSASHSRMACEHLSASHSESEQSKHEKSCTEARAISPDCSNSSEPLNSGTQLSDCNQCSAKPSKKPDSSNTCPVPEEDALTSSLSLRTCNFCQKIFDTESLCKTRNMFSYKLKNCLIRVLPNYWCIFDPEEAVKMGH